MRDSVPAVVATIRLGDAVGQGQQSAPVGVMALRECSDYMDSSVTVIPKVVIFWVTCSH